mmetsp:Transcript_24985/g.64848  ORF Transcript_24985/g.64848 Transcript_24985/m.64848 type:complete len:378 (-) Transcript_24985:950-2083(-)
MGIMVEAGRAPLGGAARHHVHGARLAASLLAVHSPLAVALLNDMTVSQLVALLVVAVDQVRAFVAVRVPREVHIHAVLVHDGHHFLAHVDENPLAVRVVAAARVRREVVASQNPVGLSAGACSGQVLVDPVEQVVVLLPVLEAQVHHDDMHTAVLVTVRPLVGAARGVAGLEELKVRPSLLIALRGVCIVIAKDGVEPYFRELAAVVVEKLLAILVECAGLVSIVAQRESAVPAAAEKVHCRITIVSLVTAGDTRVSEPPAAEREATLAGHWRRGELQRKAAAAGLGSTRNAGRWTSVFVDPAGVAGAGDRRQWHGLLARACRGEGGDRFDLVFLEYLVVASIGPLAVFEVLRAAGEVQRRVGRPARPAAPRATAIR